MRLSVGSGSFCWWFIELRHSLVQDELRCESQDEARAILQDTGRQLVHERARVRLDLVQLLDDVHVFRAAK